jgi:hypothetical protein
MYDEDDANEHFQSILLKTIRIPKNIMHLSNRLPKKNYQNMTGGYNSEERKPLNSNFQEKGFHHNTMGKNASIIEKRQTTIESPHQLQNNTSLDRNSHERSPQDPILKLPKIGSSLTNHKQSLSPVPSLPSISQQRNSALQQISDR